MSPDSADQAVTMATTRSFGIEGALPSAVVGELARAAEASGYRTLWTNDTPDGDGLAALRAAADATGTIGLGVGLLPLDRVPAARIVERVGRLGLPVGRLRIGLGAGAASGGLARVRRGVPVVAKGTGAAVVVGALGPRMCQLAGEVADGVLLDWPTPASVGTARERVADGARSSGRAAPRVAGYVFTALGPAGVGRLRAEAAYYASVPAYAAHFARAGADPLDAAVHADTRPRLRERLAVYDAVLDEVVVRAVVDAPSASAYLRVLDAAAPPDAGVV
jgi:alkanesulfonate monooxygenase SsuD/methylene tetrahydromethanopterin reductase-like flavin-dependent oxidoreductase (luciferase family)